MSIEHFFKDIDSELKAYLLAWFTPRCLLHTISVDEISVSGEQFDDIVSFYHESKNMDLKNRTFPQEKSEYIKHFIRGIFDCYGAINELSPTNHVLTAQIRRFDENIIEQIAKNVEIPYIITDKHIEWRDNSALDFLGYLYQNVTVWRQNHYAIFKKIATWNPPDAYSLYWGDRAFEFIRTRPDAIAPGKEHISDSGFDLSILEKIKTVGDVEFFDTGLKIKPQFGIYFDMVPRSSLSKTGYMLANSVGVIDRTYTNNVIVALRKVNKEAPEMKLPFRAVQIIPRPVIHVQWNEVKKFDATHRGDGGFGSTDKK